jgi:hypothetical protein
MAIIFDPFQFKEFGGQMFEGENFSVRYYASRKVFIKSIYIPFGPVIKNIEGVKEFTKFLQSFKFTKMKIDLPLIFHSTYKTLLVSELKKLEFNTTKYLLDEETLIVTKETFSLNDRNMRYVRSGLKNYNVEIKTKLDSNEVEKLYGIYTSNAKTLNYEPKSFEAFSKISENSISAIAINKETDDFEGFLMGYKNVFLTDTDNEFHIPSNATILQLIFTGLTENGRNSKLGFALHNELFNKCFNELGLNAIDFHGASRNQNRSYTNFKMMFGGTFVSLPGSYLKIRFI